MVAKNWIFIDSVGERYKFINHHPFSTPKRDIPEDDKTKNIIIITITTSTTIIPAVAAYEYTACRTCNKSFKRHETWYKHFQQTGHLDFSMKFNTKK
jgi:hypothetical protein